jgi:hypothetical protein
MCSQSTLGVHYRSEIKAITSNPMPEPSAIGKGKEEKSAPRSSMVSTERKAVLDHSDILRMTSDKN